MKEIRKNRIILYALLAAGVCSIVALLGGLKRFDRWAQDTLFQQPKYQGSQIMVIGIDEKALGEVGAYHTWDRNIMAHALEMLARDPENLPAVVAIDTLYSGETDPEADAHLAEAASKLPVVVTASVATYAEQGWYTDENGKLQYDPYRIVAYEEPYDALKAVSTQGHINAMTDVDGVMRHALLYVEPGERTYSMSYETAKLYLAQNGESIIAPPTDRRGQYLVDYTKAPGDYYDCSFATLYKGELPPDHYAGKIVLIGPYATGLQDSYYTPIDHGQAMYGVEFQANVIQQILAQNYKREVSDLLQASVLFAVCFVCGIFFFKKKIIPSTILALVVAGAGAFGTCLAYEKAGLLLHPLWIPAGIIIIYAVSNLVNYIRAAAERRAITHTFERYVAPEIVQEILKEGTESLSLGGKLCNIAVLFVDVRGFTTMSERLDPEKVVFILNRYLTMASTCVEDNKGTLDKFVGDAMMAFWGAPLPQEDAVYNAVKTAKAIVDGAARVSAELKEEIGEELNVGVGVHYGPAVVGNMGSERHMDYTAIGDTVNTSARLEANAPKGCVYISRIVADELGDRITYTSLGDTVKLKGKAEGFEVLRLESIR